MNMIKDRPAVVIHGSAARWAADRSAPSPRDVDVIYSGCGQTRAAEMANEWAAAHGLEGLELDLKPALWAPAGEIVIPCAWTEENGHAVALTSGTEVRFLAYRSLSALIRSGLPAGEIAETAAREQWRLTVVDPAGSPWEDSEWDNYIEGFAALRSAADKNPAAWAAVVAATPWGRHLDYLLTHGPRIQEERADRLRRGSSGGENIVVWLDQSGMGQQRREWPRAGAHYAAPRRALTRRQRVRREQEITRMVSLLKLPTVPEALGVPGVQRPTADRELHERLN